jgi:hypothetical protein
MSACGGMFTMMGLTQGRGDSWILLIAVPSLLAGIGCMWGAAAGIRRAMRKPEDTQRR